MAALMLMGLGACASEADDRLQLRSLGGDGHLPIPSETEGPTVLLFAASDCPVANGYAPKIRGLRDDYADRGLRFFVVNVERTTPVEELTEHAQEFGLPRPILLDRDHRLAQLVGAEITPEAVVLGPGGTVLYRGRIDDQHAELGVRRPSATTSDLRDALDAVLAGRAVAVPRTKAVGCLIEDWAE